jgi:hypothetical protein
MRWCYIGLSLLAALSLPGRGEAQEPCPRTTATDQFGAWRPGWYGTEGLAVQLGSDERWGTTVLPARISAKVLWWSAAYRPGTESSLKVEVKNLRGGPMTARVLDTTNAYLGELDKVDESNFFRTDGSPDKWFMLTGIAFPDAGCWQITGEYFGQTLTFVVETVAAERVAQP